MSNYLTYIPEELLLLIREFLSESYHMNFRVAYKPYYYLNPVNFDIKSILDGLNNFKKGDKAVHFTNKETCGKVIRYVQLNYAFYHVCCGGKGIMLKDDKYNKIYNYNI